MVRPLSEVDAALILAAGLDLFDGEVQPGLVFEFLDDPRHHLVGAIEDGALIGFVSAIHYVHPDKPPELWINEVSVAPAFRRQGVAKAMMAETLALGTRLGCKQAWVLTEAGNQAAKALYASAGGAPSDSLMYSFRLHD